jgi:hypothetical protein
MRIHSPSLKVWPSSTASPGPARLGVRSSDGGPERFFDSEAGAKSCPETALLCAVLENAFDCFQNRFELSEAQAAENWFLSDDSRAVFSFVSVCAALGLEPGFIRKRLRRLRQPRLDSARRKG